MHCLLCHEKIPRLRAWTGKSEFCCDEHADLYKKQTMDRLLVDDSESKSAAPALPIFDGGATSVDHVLLKGQPKKAKQAQEENEIEEVDELWKLAARMGGEEEESPAHLQLEGVSSESPGDIHHQSADEALAALQALAAEAAQTKQDSPAEGDLLDEFSNMESALEGLPQLDSLPIDLALEIDRDELDEAPEPELDALESAEAKAGTRVAPEPFAQAAGMGNGELDEAPELELDALESAEAKAETRTEPEPVAEAAVHRCS